MNITRENTGDLTATLKIQIKAEDYQANVEKILKDYQKKAQVPGFRAGKAPQSMIKHTYGAAVMVDEINKLLSDTLDKYIKENNIEILGNPMPNNDKTQEIDWTKQSEFEFYFDLGLSPKFDVKLEKVKADQYNITADESMLEKYLTNIQKRYGKYTNPETSQAGDIIIGHIQEIDNSGNVIENGISNNTSIAVDFIKADDIKNKFINIKFDDIVDFDVKKAFDNASEISAMLNITKEKVDQLNNLFRFKVAKVSRIEPSELNEELFKKIYPTEEIKTIDAFKDRIRKDIETSFEGESERKLMDDIIKYLIKNTKMDLPNDFMKRWIMANSKEKITKEQLDSQYDQYKDSLKWQLIENKLIKDNNIEVTTDEVKQHIREFLSKQAFVNTAGDQGNEQINKIIESVMQNKDEVKRIYDQLYDKKLITLFKSIIKLNKKDISYENFIKLASENK